MKKGLTIGELLVAMSIIGVIAILVLPGFIQEYHNTLYVTSLKKVYEQIEVAINQASMDSEVSYFRQTRYTLLGKNADGENVKDNQQAFLEKYFKIANSNNNFCANYLSIADIENGTESEGCVGEYTPETGAKMATVTLTSGEALGFFCREMGESKIRQCYFHVDINGKSGPNVGGRDKFLFVLDTSPSSKREQLMAPFRGTSCINSSEGNRCFEEIVQAGWKMDYEK